jgi:hypothetical protein
MAWSVIGLAWAVAAGPAPAAGEFAGQPAAPDARPSAAEPERMPPPRTTPAAEPAKPAEKGSPAERPPAAKPGPADANPPDLGGCPPPVCETAACEAFITENTQNNAFDSSADYVTGGDVGIAPAMIGDFIGGAHAVTSTTVSGAPTGIADPVLTHGPYKVAEFESPQPQDRLIFSFNYFDAVRSIGGFTPTTVTRTNVYREMGGFEKTIFGGVASFEVRAPVIQTTNNDSLRIDDYADTTVLLKVALYRDVHAPTVVSGGLAITAPSGPGIPVSTGTTLDLTGPGTHTIRDTVIQPWVGGVWSSCANGNGWYLIGFSSVALPTDSRDVKFWFNDLGIGYLMPNPGNQYVSAVSPTFEVHAVTPLNHHGDSSVLTTGIFNNGVVFGNDLVDAVLGVHFISPSGSVLTVGAVTDLTGPRQYDVGAIAQLAIYF